MPAATPTPAPFGFVQLEFGFLLGPPDGSYMVRSEPEAPLEAVLVLTTLGAPERRRLRGRRGRPVEEAAPEPVPTSRATVVRPEPFGSGEEAARWLAAVRADDGAMTEELARALRVVNLAVRAHRAATANPWVGEVSAERALVARIGYGRGEAVAEGRFGEALELPRAGARRVKRSMEAPEERFAALLGARQDALVGEELVLRARADIAAGRYREAALQARVALEAVIAELPGEQAAPLAEHRGPIGEAANAALRGALETTAMKGVEEAVAAMEAALRRHRLRG
ncbi:MAG TPA: hypothetical protein VG126_16925 [Thermoleophilaceae bacterium]|nr:hypothetical protein [Thermoleophilaceae bacterium]